MISTLLNTATITSSTASAAWNSSLITSTYDEYMIVWTDVHSSQDNDKLYLLGSTDNGSSYGVTKTTTLFYAYNSETEDSKDVSYNTDDDRAQQTTGAALTMATGADADQSTAGILHIYSPSITTYVKHFTSRASSAQASDYARDVFAAGYWNTTTAINNIKIQWSGGNIDNGVFQLYGIA